MVYVSIAPQASHSMQVLPQGAESFAQPPGQMVWLAPLQQNDLVQPFTPAFAYPSTFSERLADGPGECYSTPSDWPGEGCSTPSDLGAEPPSSSNIFQHHFVGYPPLQLLMDQQVQEQVQEQPHNYFESFVGQPPIQCYMPQDMQYGMGAEMPHQEMDVEVTHYEVGSDTPRSFDDAVWAPFDVATTATSEGQGVELHEIEEEVMAETAGGANSFELTKSTLRRRRRQRAQARLGLTAEVAAAATEQEGVPPEERVAELLALLRAGGDAQRSTVARFRRLAFDSQCSSRVAQIALEEASASEAVILLRALRGNVREAMRSMFANYVVQRAVELLPTAVTNFIPQELLGIGADVARHRFGCRIFCRLLEHGSLDDAFTNALLEEVLAEVDVLARHTYGNFVIRHCLEFGHPLHRRSIAAALCENLVETARDQSGSRVIETALEFCEDTDKGHIAETLLANPDELISLSTDPLGRHVVKALLRTPGGWQRSVADTLSPAIAGLRKSKQGRPVIQALSAFAGTKS
jgi:hypothetical protein